jgi:Flp pilus assembly protein protease CpaA
VVVALRSIRRRKLGNSLIVLGVAAAATGSGLAGIGAAGTAVGIALGAALLYAGFVLPAAVTPGLRARTAPEPSR